MDNQFVSDFASWTRDAKYPDRVLRRLPDLLRRLPQCLSEEDVRQTLFVRSLPNDGNLRVQVAEPTNGVYASGETIVFWALGPYWNLRHLSSDPDASEVVSKFLFFAAQHALRSRILNSSVAVALVYDRLYDFRHANLMRLTVGPDSFAMSLQDAMSEMWSRFPPDDHAGKGRKSRAVQAWAQRLNAMDPYVQRGIFQYWRARSLWQSDFGEDAVTALDGLSAVAGEALNHWMGVGTLTRAQLARTLGMSLRDARALASLYDLRCAFGAHPAASKWWDFSEIYSDDIEAHFDVAVRLLGAISDLEAKHRSVNPAPTSWSEWFEDNASMLLDAVWFARLP